jgi:hypothetical protein
VHQFHIPRHFDSCAFFCTDAVGAGVWNWLTDGLEGVWNAILRTIGSGVNSVIDILNGIIHGWNAIPDWLRPGDKVSDIGRVTWGQVSTAPASTTHQSGAKARAFAKGGIVKARPGGILANIAEAGHDEAVIPLDGRHGLGGNVSIYIYPAIGTDENKLARSLGDLIARQKRSGGPLAQALAL